MDRSFYARDTLIVARDLLGCVLVHKHNEARVSGRIVEVEAYCGHDDLASHASRGKTPRTAVMFGQPGTSYVYFIYGRYWLFNVVAKPSDADYPAAVLIRSLEPLEGLDIISQNRQGRPRPEWTNGPARLTLALGINGSHNTLDLADL
nr:DNA-3-methyladenine glycosylase [Anaerolineae bacterium]